MAKVLSLEEMTKMIGKVNREAQWAYDSGPGFKDYIAKIPRGRGVVLLIHATVIIDHGRQIRSSYAVTASVINKENTSIETVGSVEGCQAKTLYERIHTEVKHKYMQEEKARLKKSEDKLGAALKVAREYLR